MKSADVDVKRIVGNSSSGRTAGFRTASQSSPRVRDSAQAADRTNLAQPHSRPSNRFNLPQMDTNPRLRASGITKRYQALLANNNIDFDVRDSEIHALLGENGSGKTTLLSILYGLISPDAGQIFLSGRPVTWGSPHDAHSAGIAMVPQQFRLVPTLTIAENVVLALHHPESSYRRLLPEVRGRIDTIQDRYRLQLDPDTLVGPLSVGERQRVEIVRALYFEPRILFLDEPTSVLTPQEAETLYSALRQMVEEEERSVVLTTHRIKEVLGHCNRVTVLRNGSKVATFDSSELDHGELVQAMVGQRTIHAIGRAATTQSDGSPLFRVEELSLDGKEAKAVGATPIRDVSFDVFPGEVFGVAGVEGNGQYTLELLLTGLLTPSRGRIMIRRPSANDWTELADNKHRTATGRDGIGHIPSDRNRFGVAATLTVAENLLLRELTEAPALSRAPGLRKDVAHRVDEVIKSFEIDPPNPQAKVSQLSGGNAQKVVVAREISRNPLLMLAAQPTAGLDVAASSYVRSSLKDQARTGRGVLIISSDLDELFELCDRLTVMYHGRLTGSWSEGDFDANAIGAAMAGVHS